MGKPRASLQRACEWIAWNDDPAADDDVAALISYVTVGLVADLFHKDAEQVAKRVKSIRETRR